MPAHVLLCTRERPAAVLMLLLALCNQANGSTTLINYAAELLRSPAFGVGETVAGLMSTAAAGTKLVCVLTSVILVDRWGQPLSKCFLANAPCKCLRSDEFRTCP